MKTIYLTFALISIIHQLFADGNNCMDAVSVGTGSHSAPNAPYWYSYTVSETGKKLVISSVGLTTTDTYLNVYNACDGTLLANSDDFFDLQSQVTLFGLEVDETVFIHWDDTYSAQGFTWSLSMEEITEGEDCSYAAIAVEGTNSIPDIEGAYYWLKFTMPQAGSKIVLTSEKEETLTAYSGNCDELTQISYGYQTMNIYDIDEGQEVFIQWANYSGGSFNFNLTIEAYEPGESCSSAIIAEEGANTVPEIGDNELFWYEFTMPSAESKLRLMTQGNGYFEAFRNSCSDRLFIEGGTDLVLYDIDEGEKIFIAWHNYEGGDLDWELTISDIAPGESCSTAIAAVLGENMVPELQNMDSYWYTFTMPQDNSKIIISTVNGGIINLYSGPCSNKQLVLDAYQNVVFFDADEGEEIHFQWTNGQNFVWNLSVEEIEPGDICTNAVTAIEGTNTIPTGGRNTFWYTFTMPEESSKIVISSVSSPYFVEVYTGTCGSLDYVATGYEGDLRLYDIPVGEEIVIKWQWYSEVNDLSWELLVEAIGPGDQCELPIEINAGTHTAPYAPVWYKYTVPESNKKLVISSVGLTELDTYLAVFDECYQSVRDINDDFGNSLQSQLTISGLNAGETILIYWHDEYSNEGFSWKLSLESLPGISVSNETIMATVLKGGTNANNLTVTNSGLGVLDFEIYQSQALSFDGVDDFIYIPNSESLNPSNNITISMWVNPSEGIDCGEGNNFRFLLYKGFVAANYAGYDVILEETGALTWSVGTANGRMRYSSEEVVIPSNQWTHVTFAYSSATNQAKMYFNGEEINGVYWDATRGGSTSWGGAIVPFDADLYINYPSFEECPDGFGNFPGKIDNISIWNTFRNAAQVKSDMNKHLTGTEQGLIGYWDFEEIDLIYANDLSPNSNDGYIYGPTITYVSGILPWMSPSITSGTINPGSSVPLTVTFNAINLDLGNYETKLKIRSKHDDIPVTTILINLTVSEPPPLELPFASFTSGSIYPNPLQDYALLPYFVSGPTKIRFSVFSLDGTLVFSSSSFVEQQGKYEVEWNGNTDLGYPVKNGVYIYRLEAWDSKKKYTVSNNRIMVSR